MIDKKLTDSEIVKALKEILELMCNEGDLQRSATISKALDLINRLQAEIERLKGAIKNSKEIKQKLRAEIYVKKKLLEQCEDSGEYWENKYKTAKAEAYKECIEKVKENSSTLIVNHLGTPIKTDYQISGEALDNILKELEGE